MDNILLSYECIHHLRSASDLTGYATFKLDMSKTYDRVEWCYLEQLMHKMGFASSWINLIIRCVDSVSYSFKINGVVTGAVTPSRGLCQGDLLSPYLFALCTQGLSLII